MRGDADTAGLLASHEDAALLHLCSYIFETDRLNGHTTAKRLGNATHERRAREIDDDTPLQIAELNEVAQNKRHDLMRMNISTAFVDRTDTVGIAVGHQACARPVLDNRTLAGVHPRLNRSGQMSS